MDHGVYTFPTPAAFFEFVLGPRQHDEHVQTRHRETVLRERLAESADCYAHLLRSVAHIMADRPTATSHVCGEVQAYMATRHLRVVA